MTAPTTDPGGTYSTSIAQSPSPSGGPVGLVLAKLEEKRLGPRRAGGGWEARCPAHEDERPSLSLNRGDDGRALVTCHAGCAFYAIALGLGLGASDFFAPPMRTAQRRKGRIIATYPYVDELRELLFEVVRFEPKDFRQRRPDGRGGWVWTVRGVRRVLYRLPEVIAGMGAGKAIWVVEGEKDADALAKLGLVATTNPHGAGKWRKVYTDTLRAASRVYVVPDADAPGERHAAAVADALVAAGVDARLLRLPGGGKDAADWVRAGGTAEALGLLLTQCDRWIRADPAVQTSDPDGLSAIQTSDPNGQKSDPNGQKSDPNGLKAIQTSDPASDPALQMSDPSGLLSDPNDLLSDPNDPASDPAIRRKLSGPALRCRICASPHRLAVDAMLDQGRSRRDVADWLDERGEEVSPGSVGRHRASHLRGAPRSESPPAPDTRPRFEVVKGMGHEAVAFGAKALERDEQVFQRNNALVMVARAAPLTPNLSPEQEAELPERPDVWRESGSPIIQTVPAPVLWSHLSALVQWQKWDGRAEDFVDCDPPEKIVAGIHQRGQWETVRDLIGLVQSPVLRRDGSILEKTGYDAASGYLYEPNGPTMPVPAAPTLKDAKAALAELLDVVVDFEFANDAYRAAWVAAVLTPLARPTYTGNTPLFWMDANTPRCGKSRLCDIVSLIVTGRTMPRSRFTDDEDELEKRVMTNLQAGDPLVLFDNIAGEFGGPTLDLLLTSEGWFTSRLLGKNSADARLQVRNGATWFATSNNASLNGDLFGRVIKVRLESTHENPQLREGFAHENILDWVRAERPRLLRAALTILRAWFVAGRPKVRLEAFGSFEQWSAVVRNVCAWVGLPDPFSATRDDVKRSDNSTSVHAALLSGWREATGGPTNTLSVGEMKALLDADLADSIRWKRAVGFAKLREALSLADCFQRDGSVNAKKLGKRLGLLKEKRLNGMRFVGVFDTYMERLAWAVVAATDTPFTPFPEQRGNERGYENHQQEQVLTPFTPFTPFVSNLYTRECGGEHGGASYRVPTGTKGVTGGKGVPEQSALFDRTLNRRPPEKVFGLRTFEKDDDELPNREPGEEG